jgi:monoamine oxidase
VFGDSDERWHAHLGNDTFTTLIAAQLSPEQVVTDARLTKIIEAEGTFTLVLARSDGTTFSANFDHVVLALPFSTLRDVDLDEVTLSDEKRTIVAELGYGTNAKVMGGFSSRVWRDAYAASGAMVTDLPAQQTWDTSIGQAGPTGIITNFLGGAQGEASGEGDAPTWFAEVAVPALEAAWPGCAAAYSGTAVRMHWPTAPHAKGSYACYRPGQWAFWGLEGVREGNLHFCGEHTSLDFQGWMEGGAETGALVAAEILDDLGVAYSRGHRAALGDKRLLPQATYHGDAQPRLRWTERRRLRRALRG